MFILHQGMLVYLQTRNTCMVFFSNWGLSFFIYQDLYLARTNAALLAVQRLSACSSVVTLVIMSFKHGSLSIHSLPSWLSAWNKTQIYPKWYLSFLSNKPFHSSQLNLTIELEPWTFFPSIDATFNRDKANYELDCDF